MFHSCSASYQLAIFPTDESLAIQRNLTACATAEVPYAAASPRTVDRYGATRMATAI